MQNFQHSYKTGFILLLVILVMSALLSIGIAIFEVVYGEIRLSGEITDSFTALYAADEGLEQMLYEERSSGSPHCGGSGSCTYSTEKTISVGSKSAHTYMKIDRTGNSIIISSIGEYPYPATELSVRRAFKVGYSL